MGSIKLEVVRSVPPTGARGETFIGKRWKQSKNYLIGYIAVALFGKAYLVVYDLLSLGFGFLTFERLKLF